jgi:hypothetical protein
LCDDARRSVDRAVDLLRESVRQRDAAAVHLAELVAWAQDVAA